ncbi:TPA: glycosyltransferase family 2 protein, partial [Klebsiella pneumoniae]|nr:glycosyltransferase family 2 protein [Klebsiella pneumoniae]
NSTSLVNYEAICGAFMLCRVSALMQLKDSSGNIGFEESFFMYKEDIELSLRIKRKWQILMFHDLFAYHCRGWGGERKKNPYWSRLISAKNDMKIASKFKKRALPFSILKYLYVILIERNGRSE